MRHMSQDWEQHQRPTKLNSSKSLNPFFGAANIIQVLLTHTIELWEERNQDTYMPEQPRNRNKNTMQKLEDQYTPLPSLFR